MKFTETKLKGSYIIDLEPTNDERGWFSRTFCKKEFSAIGHEKEWVQVNQSFTAKRGTIRGMHFQFPPHSEVKLIRCIAGAIHEVIIDLRHGSDTFLQWISVELSAENKKTMYVPEGFAHGFQTLTDDVEMIYHHSDYFVASAQGGVAYNDPEINIHWPIVVSNISEKDNDLKPLDPGFDGLKTI